MILRTSGIGVSIAFLREAQWGSRGREFDSRHSDQSSSVERLKSFLLYLKLLQTTEPQSFGRLRLCFILLYLPSARSFASFSSRGLRYWPVKLPGTSATCSGVPSATMRPPALPPSGPPFYKGIYETGIEAAGVCRCRQKADRMGGVDGTGERSSDGDRPAARF